MLKIMSLTASLVLGGSLSAQAVVKVDAKIPAYKKIAG